jgi:pimeloyl-ACP methyl ester carboxylesterase
MAFTDVKGLLYNEGFSKFVMNFIETIAIKEKGRCKITLVGHSLGGYIAAHSAIQDKQKVVLVDTSGLLERATPLLEDYYAAAMEINPITRFE